MGHPRRRLGRLDGGYGIIEHLGAWGKGTDGTGIVGPMITYLLPLLIGYTGGRMVYGASAAASSARSRRSAHHRLPSVPMFLGAMVMGPLGGWSMKKVDALWDGKIKPGFEMLVNNFSAGILRRLSWRSSASSSLGPIVAGIIERASATPSTGSSRTDLLPLASIFIEPAKVLFLNNAINHGVLTPLGIQQAAQHGKSILFLLEANPGPGARSAAGLRDLRHGDGQGDRTRRRDHPVLRRHPRDLLPVRADEAD